LIRRRAAWSAVLERIFPQTKKPILVHPVTTETGFEAVNNPGLLAANTAQTGHHESSKNRLWQLPLEVLKRDSCYLNLEPWYEGIRDRFFGEDQLFAYWVSMLSGAASHCYGAHGIWNAGDGGFLAHWGGQTFDEAVRLSTPALLGLSHGQYIMRDFREGISYYRTEGKNLLTIERRNNDRWVRFHPDASRLQEVPEGKIWRPMNGTFEEQPPSKGPVVVFKD
jgi:hypothetical protein